LFPLLASVSASLRPPVNRLGLPSHVLRLVPLLFPLSPASTHKHQPALRISPRCQNDALLQSGKITPPPSVG
ncbi:hypothetical protein T440DRAFT_552699, partial [Plenodomus tracheiphilus IPT5]